MTPEMPNGLQGHTKLAQGLTQFKPGVSNMIFGRNLQHMAPFGMPTSGFCMVFQCTTLVFSAPGGHFGIPDPRFGSWRAPAGLGTFFAQKNGLENLILWRKWFPMGFQGDLCEGIGLYGTQEAFGQARFLPNPLKK